MSKKKVLITGGTRGIGKSISKLFYENGYSVYITGTKENKISDFVKKCFIVDFANEESTQKFLIDISDLSFNVLVNNAGINIIKPIENVSEYDFDKIINVNLKSPYFLTKEIYKNMANEGKIINISSIFGYVSKEFRSLYTSTKYALNGLTKSCSIEFSDKKILVNSVLPGFTETELTFSSLSESELSLMKKNIPLKRLAKPNEIAELVYFLGSDKNTYITGQTIIIDGGFTSK